MVEELIEQVRLYVKEQMPKEGSHDYWHVYRVWKNAQLIISQTKEALNTIVIELAALLHDLADRKVNDGDEEKGKKRVLDYLNSLPLAQEERNHIMHIINTMSFSSEGNPETIEGKIVQDADRLDAIGAIGIGRTFAYGGSKGRPMYDPEIPPVLEGDKEAYKNNDSNSINHFYEKLLKLAKGLNTEAAKKVARHRHEFLNIFLQEFLDEWEGRK